ncbi:MAG: dTMP kinase, partial [Candidatus Desantisbacteria bacterium]
MSGIFITFEGIEYCGKTTQSLLLIERLKEKGCDVVYTREPGGTNIGEDIRKILLDTRNSTMNDLTEVLLYTASRVQHIHEVIQPALLKNKIVVCDRFMDATIAYQGYARGLDMGLIYKLQNMFIKNVTPNLTLLLDITPEQGLLRAANKRLDRIEKEDIEFHCMVRQGYLQIAEQEPDRVKVIDGSSDVDNVHQMICEYVDEIICN